jgi:malonate-semialdehyde dehydrogenase (acetylating)/methylmalonate-semialdehyde dehydrogenase
MLGLVQTNAVVLPDAPLDGRCFPDVDPPHVEPEASEPIEVRSPYTGGLLGTVPRGGPSAVAAIVAEASRAQPAWAATPIKERAQILLRARSLLLSKLELLANSAARESGKTLAEGRAGVEKGIEVLEFAASIPNLDLGGILEVSRGVTCEVRREPLGVVAGITPFNFPAMVPMWMFPIAIAVGNAFVLKPSEKVPFTANLLAETFAEAGVPRGIFSVVHGGAETASAIVEHPEIAAIGFVGSSPVARRIHAAAAALGKRVLALGGAKNHLIVAPDADRALTAQAVVDSFTGCAGQRCMAGSVLVLVGDARDAQPIVEAIVERAAAIEVGATMGAIVDRAARDRIVRAIEGAERAGARILLDGRGKLPRHAEWSEGSWLGPTILDGVDPRSEAAQTEIFGPVLSIVRVPTIAEALAIEAASPYGNACSIFTTSGAVAEHVGSRARAGMIGVNVGVPVPREPFSFGGIGDSRFGHGDVTGRGGIEFWSQLKKITRKWAAQTDASWMS